MLLADVTPQRRLAGLGVSTLLHGAVFSALLITPGASPSETRTAPDSRKYSVLVLHLNRPLPRSTPVESVAAMRRRSIPFVAPSDPKVRQTLIQPDVPPSVKLATEIPLPNLAVWSDISRLHREFVAPPVENAKPEAQPQLSSAAPVFQPQTDPSQLAMIVRREKSVLVFAAPPVAAAKSPAAPVIIDAPPAEAAGPNGAGIPSLLSQSDFSAITPGPIAIPPANQVAYAVDSRDGKGPNGLRESTGAGRGGNGTNGSRESTGEGRGGSSANGARDIAGLSSGANGSGEQRDNAIATVADLPIPGTTRLTLPKQGSFGLVVTGSSVSAPYAETIGALSGRVIYSVYLPMQLPKKWILEYCLPRSDEQGNSTARTGALDAPWPWFIVRPDDLGTASQEYLVVHGTLTAQGHFEQLAMVFPQNPRRKDLLFASLRQWTFRPAARDGVPAAVEVLLIIPGQPD